MEDKLLDCIKHIKEVSKQKVSFDRIISYLKKNEETTNHDEIQQILDKLISENQIEVRDKSYFISTTVDTVLVPETQLTDEVKEENNTFIPPLVEESVHSIWSPSNILSKAFDSLSYDLLIAKLNAYGFSLPALKLVHSYLSNRKQRTKFNNAYSSWEEILFGVPQGSILGPILFNIFLSDFFLVVKDTNFVSYADDSTIYDIGDSINDVLLHCKIHQKNCLNGFLKTN